MEDKDCITAEKRHHHCLVCTIFLVWNTQLLQKSLALFPDWVVCTISVVTANRLSFAYSFAEMEGTTHFLDTPRGRFHSRLYGGSDEDFAHDAAPPPVLVCVHGAGMSSASFGPCGQIIAASESIDGHPFRFRVASLDLRCHGLSHDDGGEGVLTLDTLIEDVVAVVGQFKATLYPRTPRLYYAGHSLGGAVVAHAATHKSLLPWLGGVVMLDIVEGVAKLSLKHMNAVLDKRPQSFSSTKEAAHWFVTYGGMYNESVAQQTVPFLLRPQAAAGSSSSTSFVWRTNLRLTQPCWDTWFEGMDKKFVSLPCPKMLLLASTDRLDKELTLGQMQGKFQLEVIGSEGHYVMEDDPNTVAVKLMRFMHRVETLSRKLPMLNKSHPPPPPPPAAPSV